MNRIPEKRGYRYLVCWVILLTAGFIYLVFGMTHESLWFDESYSAVIINHSILDIIRIVPNDSHPPLYFILLKLFCMIFGKTVFGLRLFSALGVIALAALGAGPVRRIFGKSTGLIFAFIVFCVPMSLAMGQEIRMYTWAAFLVTGCALYGYLAVTEGNRFDFFRLGLFTLAAGYTHYYALMAVAIANSIFFVYLLIKGREKLKAYLITAGISILLYLPWIFVIAKQASRVKRNYWIPPLTSGTIFSTFIFPFSNKFNGGTIFSLITFGIFLALIVWGLIRALIKRIKEGKIAFWGFMVYVLTILVAVAVSNIFRPILVERYSVPAMGLFILAAAFGISKLNKKVLIIGMCIIILGLSIPNAIEVNTERFNGPMAEVADYIKANMKPDDIFVHTDEHTFGTFCYYFPENKSFLYLPEGFEGYSGYSAYAPTGTSGTDVESFIKGKKNIWLVEREGSPFTGDLNSYGDKYALASQKSFKLPASWFALTVARVVPKN